jgi:predicted DNA-binding transcriptional regulator AlpA
MTESHLSRVPARSADTERLLERNSRARPSDTFLTAMEVIARYGWGRTKGYRVLRSEGFPRPIGGDRYRLDSLLAWEESQLAAEPRQPVAAPALPARKRMRSA